ncbi:MAG: peptidylprolyl isomerase [Candidatus Schekmanbacteria bacterium]|nr:peptidylprolyl isomerase [Candidatus Schekmanbacteria bacterium]
MPSASSGNALVPSEGPDKTFTLDQALEGLPQGREVWALLHTNMGTLACLLYHEQTPRTVANFVGLARGKKAWRDPQSGQWVRRPLYDGTIFHRVIPSFMIQGGDPQGTGRGGPGYRFADELVPTLRHDRPGILSMANAGPDSNGSQFFITETPTPHLNNHHSVFGHCDDVELVKKIARVDRTPGDRPAQPVTLESVEIERR